MPKRWIIGGVCAVFISAGLLTYIRNTAAEQPTKPGKIIFPSTPRSDAPIAAGFEQPTNPEKIIISDVIISGNHRMSTEEIKARLHTKPGKEYDPAVVDDDVRELYKTGQFSNITTWLNPDGTDRAKIYFGVREMPNMVQKVTFLGAKHIKPDELQKITGVRPSMPIDTNLNHLGCLKIREKYAAIGRSFADCQLIKGGAAVDTEVVYQITEGPKVKVRDIKFVGDFHFVSAARLATQAKLSRVWFHHIGGIYNKPMADADVGLLDHYFRSNGYLDARISLESQRSAEGREVTLIFHIDEGARYRVQEVPDVDVASYQEIPREQLIALSAFKPGDYLDEEAMKQDIKAITDYLSKRGVAARVAPIPLWVPDTPGVCNVRYEVIESLCRIGKIHIRGNKRISNESIMAHISLQPGQTLSASELQQAEKKLSELGVFVVDAATGVRPTITVIDSDAESECKDLLITVKEKPKRTKSKE